MKESYLIKANAIVAMMEQLVAEIRKDRFAAPSTSVTPPFKRGPAAPLTRTEIFLRLVDSFCKQPGGFRDGWKEPAPVMAMFHEIRKQADEAYSFWGGW